MSGDKPGPIPKAKLQAFTIGLQTKTPFQKQREENEGKRRKEAEDAARVYAEFVSSFEDEKTDGYGPKSFVRGEVVKDGKVVSEEARRATGPRKPELYKPSRMSEPTPVVQSASSKPMNTSGFGSDEGESEAKKQEQPKKKRALDEFLEEIKREQADRDSRMQSKASRISEPQEERAVNQTTVNTPVAPAASLGVSTPAQSQSQTALLNDLLKGSFDNGDPSTTNIYVGNLHPQVTEDMLCREFGKHGPIASVKIMWPRTDEERVRSRNSGFVSFMQRKDAEKALKDLEGKEILGYQIRIGWGKSVPIPPAPIYDPGSNLSFSTAAAPAAVKLPFNARPNLRLRAQRMAQPPPGTTVPPLGASGNDLLEVPVDIPEDKALRRRIHRTVEFVVKYGPLFEMLLIEQQWNNPDFLFLVENTSPPHVYYRWRLYSVMQGDKVDKWKAEPFHMFLNAPIWIPPVLAEAEDDSEKGKDRDREKRDKDRDRDGRDDDRKDKRKIEKKGVLSARERDQLEDMLRDITMQRQAIAEVMVFAMEHADAADEIAEVIVESLTVVETPLPVKVARLFLVSDILHNSSLSVPNAWKFRSSFENRLGLAFVHFNHIYRAVPARLRADQFKNHVMHVLSVWERWTVYTPAAIQVWRTTFNAPASEASDEILATVQKHSTTAQPTQSSFIAVEKEKPEKPSYVVEPVVPFVETKWAAEEEKEEEDDDDDDDIDGVPLA